MRSDDTTCTTRVSVRVKLTVICVHMIKLSERESDRTIEVEHTTVGHIHTLSIEPTRTVTTVHGVRTSPDTIHTTRERHATRGV